MISRICQHRTISPLLFLILSIFATPTTHADDISVFGHLTSSQKPNILFVLDYSNSMNWDINGYLTSDTGLPSRISILRSAVTSVLNDSQSTINAGLSFFHWGGTGIKWPITDLQVNANLIDPSIPASAGLTAKDVIINLINYENPRGRTATVLGLMEAALYFQGGPVALGGLNPDETRYFKPGIWSTGSNVFANGNEYAAHPMSYLPHDAYQVGVPDGRTHFCTDYSVGGLYPTEYNYCEGKAVFDCTFYEASSGYTEPSETSPGGPWSTQAYNACKYIYPDSWIGANYISPISESCQENIIVLVSDGEPTERWDSDPFVDLLGHGSSSCEDLSSQFPNSQTVDEANCGPEFVKLLFENDQIPTIPNSNVRTYTVGFKVEDDGKQYLERLATDGGGRFFAAENPQQLVNAFKNIIREVLASSESFAELSIDVDRANFSDDNRVYFPLFSPANTRSWNGNLKGYFLTEDGLKDINNEAATNTTAAGTVFVDTAQSFWSATADGNKVDAGGASALLANTTRNLYTYTAATIPAGGSALKTVAGTHDISVANTALTTTLLGLPTADAATRTELINWLHDAPMGDPLHTRAVVVSYNDRSVVYTMTNQGLLHAIDATNPVDPSASDTSGGEELFAFMPAELLPNIADHRGGINLTGQHIYGLDGGITRWHDDDNKDGIVNGDDKLMLIFGMRRGGNSYYALDVTDPTNPILKWQIKGGTGDFTNLAQSWSRMSLVTVKKSGGVQKVLVFGGGYDAAVMDSAVARTPAAGSSIYMVDRDGFLIWSADNTDMKYSIPSDITVIDSDDNGVADRFYVGDLGGQVWRVDFDDVSLSGSFTITKLADLGDSVYRPIFYPPSVSLNGRATDRYMSVVVGTGNRANPMEEITENVLAMIKDANVNKGAPASAGAAFTLTDMFDATSNAIGSADTATANNAATQLIESDGWFISLASGEKALSSPVSFEGKILATTFQSAGASSTANSCDAGTTEGRYYAMSIRDGQPAAVLKKDGTVQTLSAADRSKKISSSGIPNSPVITFPKGVDSPLVLVDRQAVDQLSQRIATVFWHPRK